MVIPRWHYSSTHSEAEWNVPEEKAELEITSFFADLSVNSVWMGLHQGKLNVFYMRSNHFGGWETAVPLENTEN